MKRVLQFLAEYIDKNVVEAKTWSIEDAFQYDDCFDSVPDGPGIYIMVAKKREFVYPKKDSPVFYIGTSKNLRNRLKTHLKNYKAAKIDFNKNTKWNYSRYNYAVAFDADVYYMRIKFTTFLTPCVFISEYF